MGKLRYNGETVKKKIGYHAKLELKLMEETPNVAMIETR